MADYKTLIYEVERGRARVTLNRPEKLNALSMELQTELNQALWEADNDTGVHAVIVRGNGRALAFVVIRVPRMLHRPAPPFNGFWRYGVSGVAI